MIQIELSIRDLELLFRDGSVVVKDTLGKDVLVSRLPVVEDEAEYDYLLKKVE